MILRSIQEKESWRGQKVLLRVDFNVPIGDGGYVEEDEAWRIEKTLQTLVFLRDRGARIILLSHFGRDGETLRPVADYLNKFIKLGFISNILGPDVKKVIDNLQDGEVVLLENLRKDPREEENNQEFAKELAELGDIYINDAFSVSHREHSSIVSLPKFLPSYIGLQIQKEIENLNIIVEKPEHPFLFILGGSKFDTKLPLIKKYIEKVDKIFIAGALLNNFLKEKGFDIKKSAVEDKDFNLKEIINNKKLILPDDLIWNNNMIVDIGQKSLEDLNKIIQNSKLILFNGPIGCYDHGFAVGTEKLLYMLLKSNAKTIIGGGHTVNLISKLQLEDKFTFISTGGGAMLEFLINGTLPGIEALKDSL